MATAWCARAKAGSTCRASRRQQGGAEAIGRLQDRTEIDQSRGKVRLDLQRPSAAGRRLDQAVRIMECGGQVAIGLCMVRLDLQGPSVAVLGLVETVRILESIAEIAIGLGIIRLDAERRSAVGFGLAQAAQIPEGAARVL